MVSLEKVLSVCAICRLNIGKREISKKIMNCLEPLENVAKEMVMSDEHKSNRVNRKVVSVLSYIRQNIATYQEKRGISSNQEFNFLTMLHTIGENLYNVIIVMATMFANLLPIVDIFFLIVRFAIEKLIEIVESTGNDRIIKSMIFFLELIALTFVVMFICGFVLAPLISMIIMFSNKFCAFLFG